MIDVVKASPAEIAGWRQSYLAALPEPQELHCEIRVRSGQPFLLMRASTALGYAIVDADGALIEYRLDGTPDASNAAFPRMIATLGIRRALCKSFDRAFLSACLTGNGVQNGYGVLFRQVVDGEYTEKPGVAVRRANSDDLAAVLAIHDGFFGSEIQAARHIKNDRVFLYVSGTDPVGCGLLTQVIGDRADYDVAWWSHPAIAATATAPTSSCTSSISV
ncbi:MAG: hypothetical protein FJX54_17575 [Alphaproteobacteria bacterium]|nr:hypothetical protein [Alphaproteobacteria bacterium]